MLNTEANFEFSTIALVNTFNPKAPVSTAREVAGVVGVTKYENI